MNEKRKKILIFLLAAMIFTLGIVSFYYWYNNTYYISTEDATVSGDLIRICPQISGKLLEYTVKEGDKVVKNQILGRLEMINSSYSNIDQSLVRTPIDGVIIKKSVNVGEYLTAASTMGMVVDPKKLFINANIEETKLGKIHKGQLVDITIDALGDIKYIGIVSYVGLAANSAFSIIPASVSGTFTKVVQRIPLRIEFDKYDENLLPGTNAVIKIHIK